MVERTSGLVMATARPSGPHLTVAGELDAAGALRLRAQVDDVLAKGTDLTLDLGRVSHLSAPALEVLVHAYRRARDSGGRLQLVDVSPQVVRVLRISGLDRVLDVDTVPARPTTATATAP